MLPGGTTGFELVTVAVFVIFVPALACTLTTISTKTGVKNVIDGAEQLTVLLANVQLAPLLHLPLLQINCCALAFTNVTPAGSGSVMVTAEAVCLPRFTAVIP